MPAPRCAASSGPPTRRTSHARPTLFGYAPSVAVATRPPLVAKLRLHVYWQTYQPGIGRVAPTPVSMNAFDVVTNDVTPLWHDQQWARDAQGQMYWEPPREGEMGGFPYYVGSDVVVLTRIARPLVVPVPRDRVLRHELAQLHGELARIHPSQADLRTVAQGCIAELEARLGALTPAQRAEPAYVSIADQPGARPGRRCSYLVDAGAPHARRIVVENPDFFDPTLPVTAVQLVVVDHALLGMRRGRGWRLAASERIRHELDYAALATLLDAR